MKPQLSLVYDPGYVGRQAWAAQLEILRSAVNHLGLKEVAFALDVSGSMLSDALNERDRKRCGAEWLHVVKAMLNSRPDPIAADLLRKLTEADTSCTPFSVRDEDEITPEEEMVWQRVDAAKRRKARLK